MKKFIKTLTLGLILTTAVFAQSPGRLDFTVTSANIPGKYAQRHCIAIWVEDANGAYINSMAVYGNSRLKYLTSWKGSSKGVKADAVTGATLKGFRAYNVTWNLKDYAGNSVPNGPIKFGWKLHAEIVQGLNILLMLLLEILVTCLIRLETATIKI